MPSRRAHVYVDKLLFGKSYWTIHRDMDRAHKTLGARRHRERFHDVFSAIQIAERLYPGDPCAIRAALMHITLDEICSRDPEFGKTLEAMATLAQKKKKRKRR